MKKGKYFCLGLFLCFSWSAYAQNSIPKRAYWHLAGTISTGVNVKMNFVKVNDSVYADCILSANGNKISPNSPESNKPSDFCGKVDAHGNFMIHPFGQDFRVFRGQISGDGKVKGEFEEGKSKEKYSFALNEMDEAGSVQFNVYSLSKSVPLAKKAKSPKGDFSTVFLSPLESGDAMISDSLRRLMIAAFNNSAYMGNDPDSVLNGNFLIFQNEYITSNEDLYMQSPDIPVLNWELLKFMHLICNEKYWLSYYVLNYAFTGGAHGLETREYQTVDLKSGKVISLDDILAEDKKQELSGLLTAKLRLSNNIPETQKLSEAGYFVDEIQPNDNFYVIPEGIGFFYNHYDIAPYASGPTEIFLNMEEIRKLLKPGILRF
jgi:hypothetical protein